MINFVTGDILLSKARVVAHGVAPNDEHASGLAHSLREQWPAMYKDFRHYCKTSHPKPGGIWTWAAADGHRIVALFTQESAYEPGARPGRANMTHVNHALHALRDLVIEEKISSLSLPRLATGVGGLSWDEVRPALEKWLGALPIPVSVYSTFRAGQAAAEPE
jgi:O-acetyl-ADP-ribose deacetylase (regulator of RNase III)